MKPPKDLHRKRLRLQFSIILIGVLISCSVSCRKEQPVAMGRPGDAAEVLRRAEQGDTAAESLLGRRYLKGEGVNQSYAEAAKWLKLAAAKGEPTAEAGLAELYEAGQGVERNPEEALRLYRSAAEKGHAGAQYALGFLYESGRGVPQDQQEAAKWFLRAADQGDALSQYDMGQRYILGVGVKKEPTLAYKYLSLAAKQGQRDAKLKLEEVGRTLTPQELTEALRLVAEFRPR